MASKPPSQPALGPAPCQSSALTTPQTQPPQRGHDGYLIDFGDIKKVTRTLCKELNEHLIVPTRSDVMTIAVRDEEVR